MIEPKFPWPGPAVVRCTLQCVYCAATFVRDYDRFDDIYRSFITGIACIRELKSVNRRTWYGRRYTEQIEERVPVKCPHCGASAQLIFRQPINEAKEKVNV